MLNKFLKYIEEENLFSPSDKVLLAVSGGRDSMVMLRLFQMAGFDFGIAHFNHVTRRGESNIDRQFVVDIARKYSIPYYTTSVNISRKLKEKGGGNFQDIARKYRYNWLEEVRRENGYDCIATAHQKDDNIETFLYRISRGTGINGLIGIPSKNGVVIRPLLNLTRAEIDSFIQNYSVSYREDSSNLSDDYDRNYIRHNIVPKFEELNNNFINQLSLTIENLKESKLLLDFLLNTYSEKYIEEVSGLVNISKSILDNAPESMALFYALLSKYGFNKAQVRDILNSKNRVGAMFNAENYQLLIDRKSIVIKRIKSIRLVNMDILLDSYSIQDFGVLKIRKYSGKPNFSGKYKYLNADKLDFPLVLRNWKPGDKFKPFGLKGKSKKLKEYFVDKKLSRFDKENILVLLNGNDICLVLGLDIAFDYRVKKDTKEVVRIEWEEIHSI